MYSVTWLSCVYKHGSRCDISETRLPMGIMFAFNIALTQTFVAHIDANEAKIKPIPIHPKLIYVHWVCITFKMFNKILIVVRASRMLELSSFWLGTPMSARHLN